MKNVAWKIGVKLSEKDPGYLGLYLKCYDTNESYEHTIFHTYKMISCVNKSHNVSKQGSIDIFSEKATNWGYTDFVTLTTLYDKKEGLLINGSVTIKLDAHFVEEN